MSAVEQKQFDRRVLDRLCEDIGTVIGQTARELRIVLETQFATLEKRIAALEAKPTVKYVGVWKAEREYVPGEMATRSGSVWHANCVTRAVPGTSPDWTLAVKHGSAREASR